MQPTKAIQLLYCYSDSNKDEDMLQQLEKHLYLLERQGVIKSWHKGRITAGNEWQKEIDSYLDTAEIILLLISSDFIASDYQWNIVVKRAMQRYQNGHARVIPVLLRPYDNWKSVFGNLKALPKGEKPVTSWNPYDNAFASIAEGIREQVEELTNPYILIQKSFRTVSAVTRPVANTFGNVASTTFGFASKVAFSSGRKSRRRRKNLGLIPVMCGIFGISAVFLPHVLDLSENSPKSNQTQISQQKIAPKLWMRLGVVNNPSGNLLTKQQLVQTSDTESAPSIDSPIVPAPGALVTIKKHVNLRKDWPNSSQTAGIAKPKDKLIIVKLAPRYAGSNKSRMEVWAQVRKCNKDCK